MIPNYAGRTNQAASVSWSLRKGVLTGSLYLPFDALATALQMMIGDRWHFVVVSADKFLSGRSSIKSYRLQRALDDEDKILITR